MKNLNPLQVAATMMLLLLSTSCATMFPTTEKHSAQALEHANVAASHGKMRHSAILTQHAQESLMHAEAAVNVLEGKPRAHMVEGVAHLKQAIKYGKKRHPKTATKHTNMALTHINASLAGS